MICCPICGKKLVNYQSDYMGSILMESSGDCPDCNYSELYETGAYQITIDGQVFEWCYKQDTPEELKKLIEVKKQAMVL